MDAGSTISNLLMQYQISCNAYGWQPNTRLNMWMACARGCMWDGVLANKSQLWRMGCPHRRHLHGWELCDYWLSEWLNKASKSCQASWTRSTSSSTILENVGNCHSGVLRQDMTCYGRHCRNWRTCSLYRQWIWICISATAFIYFDEKKMWRQTGFEEMLVSPAKRDPNEMGGTTKTR